LKEGAITSLERQVPQPSLLDGTEATAPEKLTRRELKRASQTGGFRLGEILSAFLNTLPELADARPAHFPRNEGGESKSKGSLFFIEGEGPYNFLRVVSRQGSI